MQNVGFHMTRLKSPKLLAKTDQPVLCKKPSYAIEITLFNRTLIVNFNQRTNGPVNAHLISWPSKAHKIQNLKIYGKEMTLTFNTHIPS